MQIETLSTHTRQIPGKQIKYFVENKILHKKKYI